MIDLPLLREKALPGDLIITGGNDFLSKLIRNGQRPQVVRGKASLWSHISMYIDSETIFESTMDFKPYEKTGKRLDNGAQFNLLENLGKKEYGYLLQYPALTQEQRQVLINRAKYLCGKRLYPIGGLFGTLASLWLFQWKSNPLQTKAAGYCSAVQQELYEDYRIGIDFDPDHTARNTSPEIIWQWAGWKRYDITVGGMKA